MWSSVQALNLEMNDCFLSRLERGIFTNLETALLDMLCEDIRLGADNHLVDLECTAAATRTYVSVDYAVHIDPWFQSSVYLKQNRIPPEKFAYIIVRSE